LRVLDERHSSSVLDVLVFPDSIRKTRWMCDYSLSLDAAENLVELTKYFLLFPDEVFARSKDRCCCCGKSLTDEVSRCRGNCGHCYTLVCMAEAARFLLVEGEILDGIAKWNEEF